MLFDNIAMLIIYVSVAILLYVIIKKFNIKFKYCFTILKLYSILIE